VGGSVVCSAQTGFVQNYALPMVIGLLAFHCVSGEMTLHREELSESFSKCCTSRQRCGEAPASAPSGAGNLSEVKNLLMNELSLELHILTLVTWLPAIGALILLFFNKARRGRSRYLQCLGIHLFLISIPCSSPSKSASRGSSSLRPQ
jgi:hypothetical protein